jgi:hypothetical protein
MTPEEINEAVAKKLGWTDMKVCTDPDMIHFQELCGYDKDADWGNVPNYCTDIAAAWKVVGHLMSKNYDVSIKCHPAYESEEFYECRIANSSVHEFADTAPMAIALAFLELP